MSATDWTLHHDSPAEAAATTAAPLLRALQRLPGQILVSWGMAGGIVAGGFLVAATTLAGRSSSTVPAMTTLLFLVGVGAGVAHGGLLAYLGRDPVRTRTEALRTLAWASLALPPALLLAWVGALWISLTAAVLRGSGSSLVQAAWIVVAWIGGAAVCAWALWVGLRGAAAALRRWRDVRVAAVITTLVFAVLATAFLASPPEIWFTDLRVNSLGAVILAFGASVWIALPVMIALLGQIHRLRGKATASSPRARSASDRRDR